MKQLNENCYFSMVSKIHGIYQIVLNHHKFKIYKSDDGEWHLYLCLITRYDDKHFLNNYKTLKDIKYDFQKNLKQLKVYMEEVSRHLKFTDELLDSYDFSLDK